MARLEVANAIKTPDYFIVNQNSKEKLCSLSLLTSYVTSQIVIPTSTGLQTVAVDGVTITGDGTVGNPLVAVVGGGVTSVNGLSGVVPLTGTANKITISVANVFNIGSDVVTLTGAQALSNKTGLISQWTNDSAYITSASLAPYLTIVSAALTYQPLDADLTAIAALGFASTSFLTKTAANTWVLDTNTYLTSVTITAGEIGFGSAGNILTSDSDFTWDNTNKNFTITGTMGQVLSNSANVWYVAQGDAGYWFTGAASTGLLGHRGFGMDLKTTSKYTMGDAASGSGNGNYFEINDTTSVAKLTTLATNGFVKTSGGTGTLSVDTNTYLTSVTPHNLLSATHPDTVVASPVRGDIIVGNVTPAWTKLALGTVGKILRSDGTDLVYSTCTYPTTTTINRILYSSANDVVGEITTANDSVLVTGATGIPSLSTTLPNGVIATTQAANDNSTKVATTAYADAIGSATNSYALQFASGVAISPADATTYYMGALPALAAITSAQVRRIYIPETGIIESIYFFNSCGTVGTAETSTFYIRLNNTTDTAIATVAVTGTPFLLSNNALSIAVTQGDYIEIKWITPTWVTNPLTMLFSGSIYIRT